MRRRLLLVEDDPTLRQALTFNLTREGYEVTSAADGEAALEAARSDRLDLVLLDVMLPGMSGVEVLRVLRREGITTPVIILSAKGDEIDLLIEVSGDPSVKRRLKDAFINEGNRHTIIMHDLVARLFISMLAHAEELTPSFHPDDDGVGG